MLVHIYRSLVAVFACLLLGSVALTADAAPESMPKADAEAAPSEEKDTAEADTTAESEEESADAEETEEETVEVEEDVELVPQKTCPIMGSKVTPGKSLYVDVDGVRIYVCCRGCIAKIKADPAAAIKTLKDKGEKPEPVEK